MLYTISETPLQTRKNNIFLSALFSLVLAVVITAGHFQYPETYNDMFFWSVIIVVVVGNVVNYYRYLRYHKGTTRCASSIFEYKCASFCIGNSRSERHQDSFGSQSEELTKKLLRLLKFRAPESQAPQT